MPIACRCGATSDVVSDGASLGDQIRSTSFAHYMDYKVSIDSVWVCPTCNARVEAALTELVTVLGPRTSYIYFAAKLKKIAEKVGDT